MNNQRDDPHESAISLVLPLDDASATLSQVGGKGAALARMAAAGLPVPRGFHITTAAYRRFVEENGLQEEILAAGSGASAATAEDPAALEEASRQIGQLFAQGTMPDEIAAAIGLAYASLGGGDLPVAVRSSATVEDLPELSSAGQQETYLNLHGAAMVLSAVKRGWASLWSARAIGYRAHQGILRWKLHQPGRWQRSSTRRHPRSDWVLPPLLVVYTLLARLCQPGRTVPGRQRQEETGRRRDGEAYAGNSNRRRLALSQLKPPFLAGP